MKKILIALLLFLGMSLQQLQAQQDALFSLYMFNGLYVNPAYAGYRECLNVQALYRNQWVNFPGSPKTFLLTADAIANEGRVGLAAQIFHDRVGILNTWAAYANYAYRLPLNGSDDATVIGRPVTKRLVFGLGLGVTRSTYDLSLIKTVDPPPGLRSAATSKPFLPDARFGIYYNSDYFYAGASINNLLRNKFNKNINNNQNKRLYSGGHLYISSGALFQLSDHLLLKPSFLWREDLVHPSSFDWNAFLYIANKIGLGLSYRTSFNFLTSKKLQQNGLKSNALIGLLEVYIGEQLRLGAAFDSSFDMGGAFKHPSYECSLAYFFAPRKVRQLTPRYF